MSEQQYFEKAQKQKNTTTNANTPVQREAEPINIQRLGAMDLQRLVGNRQTGQILRQTEGSKKVSTFIQTKMTVTAADDAYEAEADKVADQVMKMPADNVQREGEEDEMQAQRIQMSRIQREPQEEDMMQGKRLQREPQEEDMMQGKRLQREPQEEDMMQGKRLQREPQEEDMMQGKRLQREPQEEDMMQGKRLQREEVDMMDSFQVDGGVEKGIEQSRGGGQGLGESQSFFENRMGYDFSSVRVHTDSNADTLNRSVSAKAFTTGNDIYFRDGAFNPNSNDGKQLLAHELTHVVQQGHAGPIQPEREDKK